MRLLYVYIDGCIMQSVLGQSKQRLLEGLAAAVGPLPPPRPRAPPAAPPAATSAAPALPLQPPQAVACACSGSITPCCFMLWSHHHAVARVCSGPVCSSARDSSHSASSRRFRVRKESTP